MQSWWTFPLFKAWGTRNEVEIYDTKTSQEDQHTLKEKIEKERIEKEEI